MTDQYHFCYRSVCIKSRKTSLFKKLKNGRQVHETCLCTLYFLFIWLQKNVDEKDLFKNNVKLNKFKNLKN